MDVIQLVFSRGAGGVLTPLAGPPEGGFDAPFDDFRISIRRDSGYAWMDLARAAEREGRPRPKNFEALTLPQRRALAGLVDETATFLEPVHARMEAEVGFSVEFDQVDLTEFERDGHAIVILTGSNEDHHVKLLVAGPHIWPGDIYEAKQANDRPDNTPPKLSWEQPEAVPDDIDAVRDAFLRAYLRGSPDEQDALVEKHHAQLVQQPGELPLWVMEHDPIDLEILVVDLHLFTLPRSALFEARTEEHIHLWCELGADVEQTLHPDDPEHLTPLFVHLFHGRDELVADLVRYRASVDVLVDASGALRAPMTMQHLERSDVYAVLVMRRQLEAGTVGSNETADGHSGVE